MSDPKQPANTTAVPPSPDPVPARRRLLRGGLAAGPVLMTLVSRPVLGQRTGGFVCTTPSGFVSANASTAGRGVTCLGRTQGFWKNASASQWPAPYLPTTLFNAVFNNPAYNPYNGKTLLDVLGLGGGPPNNVARDIVAALLNAQAGLTPVLTVSAVKDIWSEFITTGFFSPQSGAHWNADEIIAYLLTTMPV
ncbi:MAG TPA: hypothetical protein VF420_14125 [Casimicrobiaceae bacterium]